MLWSDWTQLTHLKVGKQFRTALDRWFIVFFQNVLKQHLWNFTHVLLLQSELRYQQCQHSEMLWCDIFGLYVIEKLVNVEMLLTFFWVKTNTQDKHVKLIQILWSLSLTKEKWINGKKCILVLIDQKTT